MCIVFYGLNMIWLLVFLAGVAVSKGKEKQKEKNEKNTVLRQRDLSPGGIVDVLCMVEIGR